MKSPDIRRYLRHGTLPQLLALDAVVRLGSVTRAAEALHLAQPTVSGHLRKLSQVAGLPLYEPGARGMVATEAGRALLAAAHDVFEALRRADAALAPLRGADATLAPRRGTRACQPA
ncbi:MAG TPA: LysR family transcriptional regulator [Burkholderiaceae bacterium]|nr:LysR family transcriptional regulator [Burkholderiaceae bacterium]